jgi:hypothetical protein
MSGEVRLIPRRWLWTKIIGIPLGLIVVAVLGVRTWWGIHARRVLQKEIDAIRARGEPLELSELASPPIPHDQNAAQLYKTAAADPLLGPEIIAREQVWRLPVLGSHIIAEKQVRRLSEAERARLSRLASMLPYLVDRPAFRRQHAAEVQHILERLSDARAACRRARALERVDWKADFSSLDSHWVGGPTWAHNRLGNVLCLAGLAAHESGDNGAAVECLRDAVALNRALARGPLLESQDRQVYLTDTIWRTVEQMAPRLALGSAAGQAEPTRVTALQRDLLDDGPLREGFIRAVIQDRCVVAYACERVRNGHGPGPAAIPVDWRAPAAFEVITSRIFAPLFTLGKARVLRGYAARVGAARQSNWPAAAKGLPSLPVLSPEQRLSRPMRSLLYDARVDSYFSHFRALASQRMAGVALAVRRFEADNAKRPARLSDLVGRYLKEVPTDPFCPNGSCVRYLPAGRPPLLYCVGPDGADGGGAHTVSKEHGVYERGSPDLVFFLNGDRPMGKCHWEEPKPRRRGLLPRSVE